MLIVEHRRADDPARLFGIDIAPVLTGAGIAGLAVGFGAQTLVRDVISGFFLHAREPDPRR